MISKNNISRFTVLTLSRLLLVRNRLTGVRRKSMRGIPIAGRPERLKLQSGTDRLDAVLVTPATAAARAAVLLCHGVGETVDDWLAVQHLLAARGIMSLGFSYAGYGRSTGSFSPENSERDARTAFAELQSRTHGLPLSLLGYSMGTGVAAAIAPHVRANLLILGGVFTTLREGVRSMGVPPRLVAWVPDIWRTREIVPDLNMPVLLLHGAQDELFSVAMAQELGAAAGPKGKLIVFEDCSHDTPIFGPHRPFWEAVINALLAPREAAE